MSEASELWVEGIYGGVGWSISPSVQQSRSRGVELTSGNVGLRSVRGRQQNSKPLERFTTFEDVMSADSPPAKVTSYVQTCLAVPAQWEGTLDDGRMFYVRFRNGEFRVSVSPEPTADVMEAVRGVRVLEQSSDDPRDGFMEEDEMRERTAVILDFSDAKRLESED